MQTGEQGALALEADEVQGLGQGQFAAIEAVRGQEQMASGGGTLGPEQGLQATRIVLVFGHGGGEAGQAGQGAVQGAEDLPSALGLCQVLAPAGPLLGSEEGLQEGCLVVVRGV